ncbi:MAG: WD40/YVTN/BNR-like repeat-containing protein, partial [Gaiellaceae bacterium]
MAVLLPVGTRKGLFLLRSDDRKDWELEGPLLPGWPVYHAIVDPRDGVLYAATNSYIYGGTVHRSKDLGRTWERAEDIGLPEESGLKLNATWHVEPGNDSELWLGGDPGVLFRSDDGGITWEVNRGLLEHPTREKWQPGAGGMCCHSIQVVDGTIYIAISAAGAFRSDDGGDTWKPINKDVAADFHPEK